MIVIENDDQNLKKHGRKSYNCRYYASGTVDDDVLKGDPGDCIHPPQIVGCLRLNDHQELCRRLQRLLYRVRLGDRAAKTPMNMHRYF